MLDRNVGASQHPSGEVELGDYHERNEVQSSTPFALNEVALLTAVTLASIPIRGLSM